MRRAFVNGKAHLFRESNRNNISAFEEWLSFVLTDEELRLEQKRKAGQTSHCAERMQHRHDYLMRMEDGSMAYDAVVRQENYYSTLRSALEKVRPCAPINVTIDFNALDEFESSVGAVGTREEFSRQKQEGTKKSALVPMPDRCYYSPRLRQLVEKSDGEYMARYGYTWENFVRTSRSTSGDEDEDEDACAQFKHSKIDSE